MTGPLRALEDLSKLCHDGALLQALQTAEIMQKKGILISLNAAYCLLYECAKWRDLTAARRVQFLVTSTGLDSIAFLGNNLIRLYTGWGSLFEANRAFNKVVKPTVFTWSAVISANSKLGEGRRALELYHTMEQSSVKSDRYVYSALLSACSKTETLPEGRLIHEQIIKNRLGWDTVLGNILVDMYAKCGGLDEAFNVFKNLLNRDVVTWSAMIAGYALHGQGLSAIYFFQQMQQDGLTPGIAAFLSALRACASMGAIEEGRLIHEQIIEVGLQWDIVIANALIDMYSKCGKLDDGERIFDKLQSPDNISWGAMIGAYTQHRQFYSALKLFQRMQDEGKVVESVTLLSILKACGSTGAIEQGRLIHDLIIKMEQEWNTVLGNTLVDMYAKCGSLFEARQCFDNLHHADVVSWDVMIAAYAQYGHGLPALDLFFRMQHEGLVPDKVTFLSVLKACTSIGAVDQGRLVHNQIIKGGFEMDALVGSALVDMYAKSGSLDEAGEIFDRLPNQTVVSYSAMIAGYAQSGSIELAAQCFERMLQKGIKADEVTFTSILAACSHAGAVEKGHQYIKCMIEDHGMIPSVNHYNCLVDLYGRAGWLDKAEALLGDMESNVVGWMSLLTACRTYGEVQLGRQCFDMIIHSEPQNAAAFVYMSNIYNDAHMWEDAREIEELRKAASAWKKPAKAWIEVNNKVHEFVVGGTNHPQSNEIYAMLRELTIRMKQEGYMPQSNLSLNQMEEKDKEDALCGHCEKLAIAFGLLSTPQNMTIRATKNLRVCSDCHNATKIISKIERREIVIRDTYRLHYFCDGVCSCGDYY